MAKRFPAHFPHGFEPTYHINRLREPTAWARPRRIFVCSMGDLFHDDVPDQWVEDVFEVIGLTPRHTFMVLTKRPHRMRYFALKWPDNLWAGVTVESGRHMERFECLMGTPYPVRFVSFEPLLNRVSGYLPRGGRMLDWVIAGCESGLGRRPAPTGEFKAIRDWCVMHQIPFFLKQMEIDRRLVKMPELDGRVWAERPEP